MNISALAQNLTQPPTIPCGGLYGACPSNIIQKIHTCVQIADVLFESQIYECTIASEIAINYSSSANFTETDAGQKASCWAKFNDSAYQTSDNESAYSSGIMIARKIQYYPNKISSINYEQPCKLKPKDSCNINVSNLIKDAFKYRFPYDILGQNPFGDPLVTCPSINIMGQVFQACYLLDLVRGLKYPLLLIFVFGALTRL